MSLLLGMSLASVLFAGAIFGFFYAWVCSTMWGLDAADPRVAIAALNPHAGEGGILGTNDQDVTVPVVTRILGAAASETRRSINGSTERDSPTLAA